MKKIVLLIIILASFFKGHAQYNFTKIDEWLGSHTKDLGGRALLVVYKDGKTVYTHSANEMSRRQKMASKIIARKQNTEASPDSYTPTTKLLIASSSKWLSAVLVMTFIDEGTLKLTDTVGKYLPILSKNGKGSITINDCLSHRTGILSPDLKESLKDIRTSGSMDAAIALIATLPMEGRPGTVFRYSNSGLQIAGAVLEKISGKSFGQLFTERIATPLQMKNTDFGDGNVPVPAGSARSTAQDYINFLSMILNKGMFNGRRILSEKSIAEMQVNRITPDVKTAYTPAEAPGTGYGFGEWVYPGTGTVSSPGLFGSLPWVDNNKKYCAFLMVLNVKHEGRQELYAELKKLVDEALQ